MNRRTFSAYAFGLGATAILPSFSLAQDATPQASGLPRLEFSLTDTGFELPETIVAGRYEVAVTNTGTMTESHFGMGKFPDDVADADIDAFFAVQGEDTDALTFEDIEFVGVPDWPQPGQAAVTGVIDLLPGRYMIFKPLADEEPVRFQVGGSFPAVEKPVSDLTVDLHEMVITLPDTAFTSAPRRWEIRNTGGFHHEVAVLPVPPELDADMFMTMMSLPEDATPPPGMPGFVYQPVAAIGILAPHLTSWLDVQLDPGHYLAACMLPFGTGYPHAMDGMFVFFDVA